MTSIFTNVGEFRRGKGNKKTRFGPRMQMDIGSGYGEHKRTPDDIAINKLRKLLDKPGITRQDRAYYAGILRHGQQLRFMNMTVMAEVIVYLHYVGNRNIDQQLFNYKTITPYIERLIPTLSGDVKELTDNGLEIIKLRLAATFFRYTRYILNIKDKFEQHMEELGENVTFDDDANF